MNQSNDPSNDAAANNLAANDPADHGAAAKVVEYVEYPFDTLRDFLTPGEQFYVRNHFPTPQLAVRDWSLTVEGAVARPFSIDFQALRDMPSRTVTAVLECAGNNRAFLSPPVPGVPWQLGGVSAAQWRGVPLADVLARAGVSSGAVEIVIQGADRGEAHGTPKPAGPIAFARSLPIAKALQPDVLLAWEMNGQPLSAEHGFPVRAIVPGWYGMASVKWVTRLIALSEPFDGFFQTVQYSYWDKNNSGLPVLRPIQQTRVKAQIARPAPGESIAAGASYRVHGAAWAGESPVSKVEMSSDGGATWTTVKMIDPPTPYAWRRWEHEWQAPRQPGHCTLMARATDEKGNTQPATHDPNNGTYQISHTLAVRVAIV